MSPTLAQQQTQRIHLQSKVIDSLTLLSASSSSSAAGARTPAAVGDALPRSAGVAEQCVEGVGVAEVALPSPMLGISPAPIPPYNYAIYTFVPVYAYTIHMSVGAAGVEALLARMQQSQQVY